MIAYIHVKTRRVIVSPATLHPDEAWVVAQGEAFVKEARSSGLTVGQLMHDRDTKFTKEFDRTIKRLPAKVKHTVSWSPNTNAFVERFIQSLQQECIDKFLVFGEQHCDVLVREYCTYISRSARTRASASIMSCLTSSESQVGRRQSGARSTSRSCR